MQAWGLISWWYGAGWAGEFRLQLRRLARAESYFDFRSLLLTLFQPYRRIDADSRRGGLEVQFRAFLDRTISRLIGALARLVLLVVGVLWWFVSALASAGWLLLWPLLPCAPILGVIAATLKVGVI